MAWFKVDDKLWGHPKWLATPPRARALWVTAGSWCAGQETDGKIPRHVLTTLGGRPTDAEALVTSGLWVTRRDGWAFHDWAIFQPDAASQRAKREAESTAGSLGNHRRWHEKRGIVVPDCEHCQASADASGTRSGGDRGSESPPNPLSGDSPPNPPDPARTRTRPDIGSPRSVGDGDQVQNVTSITRGIASIGLGGEPR